MDAFAAPETITFAIYLVAVIGIGAWVYSRTRTLEDFVLGGRRLNAPTAALSAQASDMSGWLLLGLPGAVYAAGVGATWIAIGLAAGTYLNWKFVAPRLRTYTQQANNALSLSAYFEERFEDRTGALRLVSAAVMLLFFAVYVSSSLVGGSLLFEEVFNASGDVAVTVAALVIVVYAFLGGFLAVSLTDALQGMLMWVALLVVPVAGILALGGWAAFTGGVESESPSLLSLGQDVSWADGQWTAEGGLATMAVVSSLAWGLGYFGQPHILARFMGIRSAAHVPLARRIGVTWVVTTLAGAVLVGLAGIALLPDLANNETVFLALVQQQLNPWLAGILLAAVLAAIMSTADSQLVVASTAITEDFYHARINKEASQPRLVWVGRASVVGGAVVAYALALQGGAVLDIVAHAWAGFGAAFGPVVVLSLYWSRMSAAGAMGGMVAGAATVTVWEAFGTFGTDVYSMVPGVAAAALTAVGLSLLGTPPARAWTGAMDEAETAEA